MSAVPEILEAEGSGSRTQSFQLLLEQLALLSQSDLAPPEYFAAFVQLLLVHLPANAGAVWEQGAPGQLRLQSQRQMPPAALIPDGALECGPLRLRGFEQPAPILALSLGVAPGERRPVAFIPAVIDGKVARLLEVWFDQDRSETFLHESAQLVQRAAALAASYLQSYQRQLLQGQQQIWVQLDAFVRTIHASLNPIEIAIYVANEGRRLVSCDRCSVAVRLGDSVRIEAVSGLDMVERRSNLVRRMRELCERVMDWGEVLEFAGTRDDSLPPAVLDALDNYLAESNCRILTVLPLRDNREGGGTQAPRSALVMECFDSTGKHRRLTERLRVIGQHAGSALYNAVEYQSVPLRLLWWPLLQIRKGLGGKTRLALVGLAAALFVVAAVLLWVPYPLKMDARGELLPEQRAWVYSPVEGQVAALAPGVVPGAAVIENQNLVLMYDPQLQLRMVQLQSEIASSQRDIVALSAQADAAVGLAEKQTISGERKKREYAMERKVRELRAVCERAHALEDRPGHFWLLAPRNGTLLNSDFRESLVHRTVKPSEPLLRVGDKSGRWEVQLKIPQQHLGQVLLAYGSDDAEAELDVDLLLLSAPTRTFKGKLARGQLGCEATPVKEDADSKPVLLATVRIEGEGIDESVRIPPPLLITGTEVHAKVRCGQRRMGYSLFYGVWEFFYEKVVFFF